MAQGFSAVNSPADNVGAGTGDALRRGCF